MDLCRSHFKKQKIVFFVISDDIKWCQKNLAKNDKDIILASSQKLSESASKGHDLALMSMMNHTILSRGSFSFWAGFLAKNASRIYPCHFPEYRKVQNLQTHVCIRHPLENPIERRHQLVE